MLNKIKEAIQDKIVSTFDNILTVIPFRKKQYISPKGFFGVLRMVEAERILLKSSFKKYEPKRAAITKDILGALVSQRPFKHKASPIIAKAYLQSLPVFTSVKEYNIDDLALAITNHYHPSLIPVEVFHISGLKVEEVVMVCRAILDDFDPTASRLDGIGISGEFIKYSTKPSLYFNAIETRRPFQYQSIHGKNWNDSERYKKMCEQKKPKQVEDVVESLPVALPAVSDLASVITINPTLPASKPATDDLPVKLKVEVPDDSDLVEVETESYEDSQGVDFGYESDSFSDFVDAPDDSDIVFDAGDAEEVNIDELDLQDYISK